MRNDSRSRPLSLGQEWKFEPADGGGTRVTIDGAVARAKRPLAADHGHWTGALDGSAM